MNSLACCSVKEVREMLDTDNGGISIYLAATAEHSVVLCSSRASTSSIRIHLGFSPTASFCSTYTVPLKVVIVAGKIYRPVTVEFCILKFLSTDCAETALISLLVILKVIRSEEHTSELQ